MAHLAIALIVVAGITVQKALHRFGQRRAANFEQKMKVIGHQHIGVKRQPMALDHFGEQSLESAVVLIVVIYTLPLIAPADDVVEGTGEVYSGSSRHHRFLAHKRLNKQNNKA